MVTVFSLSFLPLTVLKGRGRKERKKHGNTFFLAPFPFVNIGRKIEVNFVHIRYGVYLREYLIDRKGAKEERIRELKESVLRF